ncbi:MULTISPECIES: twin transmembrane helix small protein [Methylomonas]|uniref:twin transmembrane helix small protein n=1 Tax=Methylomonas TaxID=416 RepID=UPI001232E634|nr:twin transmembrane helix small protein [Methylomonas rhizoryzae]
MSIKLIALVIFGGIVISLGIALFHLVKGKDAEESRKTAQALTFRIGLSLALFVLLFLAYASGLFRPSGIGTRMQLSHDNAISETKK